MYTNDIFKNCIEACLSCAKECDQCATQCLSEGDATTMARCIELDRACAEACYASARLMNMNSDFAILFCNACAEVCIACAEECERHEMDHCQQCAESCRTCASECLAISEEFI